MSQKNWSFSRTKAITFGASELIENFGTWVVTYVEAFVVVAFSILPTGYFLWRDFYQELQESPFKIIALVDHVKNMETSSLIYLSISVAVAGLVTCWMWMGMKRIALDFYMKKETGAYRLFVEPALALNYFIATILFAAVVGVGLIFMIVPGVMAFVTFRFYGPAIVEHKYGPLKALSYSFAITAGKRMEVFIFILLTVLLSKMAGIFSVLGLPFILLTDIYFYKKLEEHYGAKKSL